MAAAATPAFAQDRSEAASAGLPFDSVRVVLDASGSMRARFGDRTRMEAATEALRTLDERLTAAGVPPLAVWAFGSRSHRLQRNCRDVAQIGRGAAAVAAAARLQPLGVSPRVHALERIRASAAPAREAWVVFTDGGDTCDLDPCSWAARVLARPPRPRIYVVGLALDPEAAAALRCLTEPTSGFLLDLRADTPEDAVERLAAIMRDRGTLRIEARGPTGETLDVRGRVYRLGREEPVLALRNGRDDELPGGLYRVVLETLPPVVYDRVLILPGDRRTLAVDDLAVLVATARSDDNSLLPAWVAVAPNDTSTAERYVPAGTELAVRPGSYRVTIEVGDTVALRDVVEVAAGERREVWIGGTGWLHARTGVAAPPDVRVELQSYMTGRTTTVRPWREAAAVPAGAYRARVATLPPYVREDLTVAPAETTALALTGLGTLNVDVRDADGRPVTTRVTLLRAAAPGEDGPGAIVGSFPAGEPQAVLEGTYDLLVESDPARVERGVRVVSGAERRVRVSLAEGGLEPGGGT